MPYIHDVIRAIRDTTMADINNLNSGNSSSSSYNNYPVSNNQQNVAKVNPAGEGAEYSHSWKRMPRPFGLNVRVPQAPIVGERTQVLAQKVIKDLIMAPIKPVIDYFKDEATKTGIPYQTLINLYLTDCVKSKRKLEIAWSSRISAGGSKWRVTGSTGRRFRRYRSMRCERL